MRSSKSPQRHFGVAKAEQTNLAAPVRIQLCQPGQRQEISARETNLAFVQMCPLSATHSVSYSSGDIEPDIWTRTDDLFSEGTRFASISPLERNLGESAEIEPKSLQLRPHWR